ncbi:MAG TPA: J domain-containing protein [Polyangia bacterium]|nr:J domain-containing protein [Polyangia bacterium]
MAAPKDYYKQLGVSETASADEIKKAYRKLAKRYHPDATGGDKTKEARFKEVSEAYETLGDDKKRAAYDELRRNPFAGGMPRGGPGAGPFAGGGANVDLNEILNRMRGEVRASRGRSRQQQASGGAAADPFAPFNQGGGGGGGFGDLFEMFGGGGGPEPRRARGEDVVARLEVELPEAALGSEKEIVVDGKHLKVKIPAGVTDGKTIRLAGQGEPGGRGVPPGDLLIELHERPHPRFKRVQPGSPDVEVEVPVPVDAAILGGKVQVPTLEGPVVNLTVPAGSSSGRKLRLRGKGAHVSKDARGDLYANISVQVPSEISPRARELIEEFAKLTKK